MNQRRPRPRYDDAVKELCFAHPPAIFRLLGVPIEDGARTIAISESLPATTHQIDALLVAGDHHAVHVEFQAGAERDFASRMLDYLLRLRRRPELEGREIVQHAVLLGDGHLDHAIVTRQLQYSFELHVLRREPTAPYLADPLLAPFAVLTAVDRDHAEVLARALGLVAAVDDPALRDVLARATATLAGLRLERGTINQTWEDSAMPIPNFLQETFEEGLQEGRELERHDLVVSMLRARFGADERIAELATRLVHLDTDELGRRIIEADTLDDLI